jgi:hypothetical protein
MLTLLLVASCGRINFGSAPGGDAAVDAIPVSEGLVAFYPMEDLAKGDPPSFQTADTTSHGHDVICEASACPKITTGRTGQAALFSASKQRLHTSGSPPDLETTSGFTVTAWISIPARPKARGCIATKALGAQQFNSWAICLEPNGTLFFYTVAGMKPDELFSQAPVSPDTWHHVAIRWTGAAKLVSLDGTDDAASMATTDFDGGLVSIGADLDSGATIAPFDGLIDEVRIYNRALSAGELATLANLAN